MKKADLINAIAEQMEVQGHNVKKADIDAMLNAFKSTITTELAAGGEVPIPEFGKFAVKLRKERQGRNPQTGEPLTIPAAQVPTFTASKTLKGSINK